MRKPLFLLVLGCGLVAACGGAANGPPPPLGRHFQDSYIAARPLEEKSEIIKTQNDFTVAKLEKEKADADLNDSQRLLDVAKNDAGSARFNEASARTNMAAAVSSADQTRIATATRDKRTAELTLNAANERVNYYTAYRAWLQAFSRYTQENTYWREALYELAKAKLAELSNIAPAGFVHNDYVKQEEQRNKRTVEQRRIAEGQRGKATEARTKWRTIQNQADEAIGAPSKFADPMAETPAVVPAAPSPPTN